ncbi:zinc-ribbon domain-containing protein, partial [Lactobacillus sp. XV13L]|nr:zinc-ribbon domain-containing protein [Lactobacillus sp. XV13L]
MKKCPNCGASMKGDVNFCTSCGMDLRNVIAQQTAQQEVQQTVKAQPEISNTAEANESNGQISSYWQWCVESWQHPAQNIVPAESWYGWATILITDLLIVLGLYYCANSVINTVVDLANRYGGNTRGWDQFNVSFGVVLEVFIIILLFEAIAIGGYYLAYKFIYDVQPRLLEFVNRGVHASNLNLIFAALFFLVTLMGINSIKLALILLMVILSLFFVGQ